MVDAVLVCFGPIIVLIALVALYWLIAEVGILGLKLLPSPKEPTKSMSGHSEAIGVSFEPIRATRNFRITKDGVPDELGGTLYILDKFADAVGSIGGETAMPLNRLPASPEIVESTVAAFLLNLRDPDFRATIFRQCQGHHHLLSENYPALLRTNLIMNLPHFVPEDEAKFLNLVIPPLHADGSPPSPEELKRHLEKFGLTTDNLAHAMDMLAKHHKRGQEIDERLRGKGL